MNTISILGVRVHNITKSEALDLIESFIRSGGPHLVVTLGTEMVMAAQKNEEFFELVNRASLVLPDGGGLIWASRRLRTPLKERVAGIDLLESLFALSGKKGWRIFFLGGKPGIAEEAGKRMREKIPDIRIVGTHHGYFKDEEILPILREARPDILLVGLGFPRQEFWLSKNLEKLGIPVGIGVGGSLDVFAGKLRRAPRWMIESNLEWLFRFLQEPRRFFRILNIPLFMIRVYLSKRQHEASAE